MTSIQKKSGTVGTLALILIFLVTSCSKDDPGPTIFIKTEKAQVSFVKVNTCHAGGGVYYTEFDFIIPYQTSSTDIEIEKIIYSIKAGTSSTEKEDYTFSDSGSQLSFPLCFKFGGAPAIDYTATLVSTEGLKSNTTTVTIDAPPGAN
jgi:hypothetical protein